MSSSTKTWHGRKEDDAIGNEPNDKDSMPESKLESLFLVSPKDNLRTFEKDDKLPSLPLPDLKHTLERYLDSVKVLVTPKEFANTVRIVEKFERGIGRKLDGKLRRKANSERNWVEKWWEEFAYLRIRLPLLPYCSMDGVLPKCVPGWTYGTEEDQIKHASLFGYHLAKFWEVLRREELKPTQTADKKTIFSMAQFRRLYNTVRVPGDEVDSLISYFKTAKEGTCSPIVVTICRGRFFSFNALDENNEIIKPPELEGIFWNILEVTKNSKGVKSGVGILTCDNRNNWSKNRKRLESLSVNNKENLDLIEKCMYIMVLDDDTPDADSDVSQCNLCGDFKNRWADKAMMMVFYKNGRAGGVCDHTAFDGVCSITCHYYALTAAEETKGIWKDAPPSRKLPDFKEITFDVDKHLQNEINRLDNATVRHKKEVRMTRSTFEDYGKLEIQRFKLHPDSYVQMALQLAYYKMHKKPAPCYETATTRAYYNGRTETLRPCTTDCIDWVKSMINEKSNNEERKRLLEKAVKRHDDLMNEARDNAGCDRHLFGLYCTALEEGLEIPDLYSDPSYSKSGGNGNFILSTSCVGYSPIGGGVAPMCKEGYGIFYNILPEKIQFTITVNTHSKETDATVYFENLKKSLNQMRQVLVDVSRRTSKL